MGGYPTRVNADSCMLLHTSLPPRQKEKVRQTLRLAHVRETSILTETSPHQIRVGALGCTIHPVGCYTSLVFQS
jgi:hypothetical protein